MKQRILAISLLFASLALLSANAATPRKNVKVKKPAVKTELATKKSPSGCWYCYQGSDPRPKCYWGCFGDPAPGGNPCEGADCVEQPDGDCEITTGCIMDMERPKKSGKNAVVAPVGRAQIDQSEQKLYISEDVIRETAKEHPRIAALLTRLQGKRLPPAGEKWIIFTPIIEITTADVEHWINRNTEASAAYRANFRERLNGLAGKILDEKDKTIRIEVVPNETGLEITIKDNPWTRAVSGYYVRAIYR